VKPPTDLVKFSEPDLPGFYDGIDRFHVFKSLAYFAISDDQINGQFMGFIFIWRRLPFENFFVVPDNRL
jgi:hypothetical protein